jgi:hypothetical protein
MQTRLWLTSPTGVLDPATMSTLSKGLNYAETKSLKSNLKHVISGVERAILHLSIETAEEIRQETSRILRHSKPQKWNTSKMERNALLTLWKDNDITILPEDKGNATVVLLSEDYHKKMETVLSDPVYTKLTMDPTNKIERNNFPRKEVRHSRRGRQEAESSRFGSTQAVWTA